MKSNHLLILLIFLLLSACSKKSDSNDVDPKDQLPKKEIYIQQSLFMNLNKVRGKTSDTQIMDSLIHYVDHVPKGESLYMSIYLFDYRPLVTSIVRAIQRDVRVNLLIDSSHVDESMKINQSAFTSLRSVVKNTSSRLIAVKNNITSTSINHEKYVLFSKVSLPYGEAKNVVFSTSHNFQDSDTKKVQDAIIMSNKSLYDAFLRNWNSIASLADEKMKNFEYKVENIGDDIHVFFFPRLKNGVWDGGDPIIEVLNKLTNFSSKDTICVGMAGFTNPRKSIAEKLVSLQKSGVRVEVVTRSEESGNEILSALGQVSANGGYVKLLTTSQINIHSKFMLIKGYYEGKYQTIVLSGSENYSGNALYNNNEQLIMLKNSKLFDDYWSYFKAIKQTL